MAPRRRMALARGFRTHLVGVLGSLRIDARAERAESFELHGMAIEDKVVDGLDESLHAALDVRQRHVGRIGRIGEQVLRLDGWVGHRLSLVGHRLALLEGKRDRFGLIRKSHSLFLNFEL